PIPAIVGHSGAANVRDLEAVLERAVVSSPNAVLRAADLPIDRSDERTRLDADSADRPTLGELERRYILRVLAEVRGSQTKAAAILGISRKALWEKRRRYRLE